MSLLNANGPSLPGGEEKPSSPANDAAQPDLMVEDGNPPEEQPAPASSAYENPRALVRLIQCGQCSKPFKMPVTLPCGHSLCRSCLPSSQARLNVSYPDMPDRQQGVTCPQPGCGAEHAVADCNIDVILLRLMDAISFEIQKHSSLSENLPIRVDEIVKPSASSHIMDEKDQVRHSRILHGGRLIATYVMAEMGELEYGSEASYQPTIGRETEYNELDALVLSRLPEVALKELDCQVCYNTMLDPVTTSCGHTFCRKCLARVLDHSRDCPMCRRTLPIPPSLSRQSSNVRLVALLNGICPDVVASRMEAVSLEEYGVGVNNDVPLFVCTISLPSMPTFLHIFEPRYRLMIRRAMETNRRFGMLLYNRSGTPQGSLGPTQFLEYGTLLEITDLQMLPDGRSYLETRGVGRFRVLSHSNLDGYTIGNIERVEDVSLAEEEQLEAEETRAAREEIRAMASPDGMDPLLRLRSMSTRELLIRGATFVERARAVSASWVSRNILMAYGSPPDDPALFPYWFATVLPIGDEEKYHLLNTRSVRERLKIVNGWIQRIESQRWCVFPPNHPLFPSWQRLTIGKIHPEIHPVKIAKTLPLCPFIHFSSSICSSQNNFTDIWVIAPFADRYRSNSCTVL